MYKSALPVLALAVLSFTSLRRAVAPLAPERDPATLFPDSTVLLVEGPGLAELCGEGLSHPLVARVLASPLGEALGGSDALRARLAAVDAFAGDDTLATLAALGSRGIALGVAPRGSAAAWALVVHGSDGQRLRDVVEHVLERVGEQAGFPDAFASVHDRMHGADVWYVGDELVVACRDGLLVASNERGYARDVLELAAAPDAEGLAGRVELRDARETRDGALVCAWLDAERLRERADGGGEGLNDLSRLPDQPAAHFLLGPDLAGLGGAKRLTARLSAGANGLVLALRGHQPADLEVLRERCDAPRPPLPVPTEDDVAVAHVYRDLAGVFRHRAALFPPEVLPELSKPLADLAVLFGGRDLAESVLPGVSPWITLVARRVELASDARPDIRLPAVAGIFRLDDADVLGPRVTAAFQTLIAIANIERAQQAQDPMVLTLVLEGPTAVSRAAFLAPPPGEGVDLRYNLEPACARVGELFVLGTHERLVRQLVRELQEAGGTAASDDRETLAIDGPAVAGFVGRNFDALVMNEVLEKGVDHDEAAEDMTGLRLLLELLASAELSVEHAGDVTSVELDVSIGRDDADLR